MSMTAQTKRKIAWGTVLSIASLAVLVGTGLWRNGGQIAVTHSIAVDALSLAKDTDERIHAVDKTQAAILAHLDGMAKGIDRIEDEIKAMR